mmetsp:Transcript_1283/g.3260  ORF Transcript_1283/g.3260 Transcript_1283/m.3260 type:complete len:210 (-) Transcript_1283:31-660(-)|eukprot:CAMPEP_0116825032 /NCGR_PEP_ID=MMETSP0418-20121206/1734_1 /TAXON_ID=1158023 /ORGANISM="Astrosyne radiata, Strain 13vi08-1A" /LENGTH=209 /DNA_ID=CAMNT_0004453483 /DNA_START=72 /DNA_END=701 /DNA_ORIENTATION=-
MNHATNLSPTSVQTQQESNDEPGKRVRFCMELTKEYSNDTYLSDKEKGFSFYNGKELTEFYRYAWELANTSEMHGNPMSGNPAEDDHVHNYDRSLSRGLENLTRTGSIRVLKNVKRAVSAVLTKQHTAQLDDSRLSELYASMCIESKEEALERGKKDRDAAVEEYKKEPQLLRHKTARRRRARRAHRCSLGARRVAEGDPNQHHMSPQA